MTKLTLLHTNDLHSRQKQVTRIGTLVRKIRKEVTDTGAACFYFDAGDCEDTVLLESALTFGTAMDAVLGSAGCDEAALGNANPIRYGPQAVEKMANCFGRPILCANLVWNDGTRPAGMVPYSVRNAGGLKLGVIGMTAPMTDAYDIFKAKCLPFMEIIPKMIDEVRAQGSSLVILLSHLGLNADRKLAQTISGIDVIIGGHSHHRVSPPLVVNDTLIVQAGEYGQVLGRLDLELDANTGRIVEYSHQLIAVGDEIPEDELVLQAIEQERQRAQKLMREEIGEIRVPVTLAVTEQCSAGNLLADALLENFADAQVSMILAQHWETGLDAGVITKGALYAANRSTGNPARVELSGQQIAAFLCEAIKPQNVIQTKRPWRGHKACMPHVAGMQVILNPNDPDDIEIHIDKRKIDPEESLIVATSDLEISDALNYLPIPNERVEYDVPTILPEVVEKYIQQHSPILAIPDERILIRTR